mmetsp:Transcript_104640/g.223660  ORF Transcript_104640/g.223660 Transcript_104640/m.223660 type:complete len:203 (-) Transcript_104640:130-738(-)
MQSFVDNLIKSPASSRIDSIVREVAREYRSPVCFVSLQDGDNLYYKSRYGLEVEGAETKKEPCFGFGQHSILRDLPIIILDASADSRFISDPLVQSPTGLRFYVGAPLIVAPHTYLGTLCIMDTEPREYFNLNDSNFLVEQAKRVVEIYKEVEVNELTGPKKSCGQASSGTDSTEASSAASSASEGEDQPEVKIYHEGLTLR